MVNADFGFYSAVVFSFSYADATGSVLIDVPETVLVPNHWRHIALQYDGIWFEFFVDGARRDVETFGGPLIYDAVGLDLGCSSNVGETDLPARLLIDEVSLSDAAIHYSPYFQPQYSTDVAPATLALWHLDEFDGAILFDEGPLGLDGALTPATPRSWRIAKNRWTGSFPVPYNSSAQSAGYNAKIAEELVYQNTGGDNGGSYTDDLEELLQWDQNLTDDPEVTFQFGTCNHTGYTFITRHNQGDEIFTMTD